MTETQSVPAHVRLVTDQLLNRVGNKIVVVMKAKSWKNKYHNQLVHDYIRALIDGDGAAPQELCLASARLVYTAFMESVGELAIAPDSYPGQRVGAPGEQLAAAS
jgi:hypothetical protein